MTSIEWYNKKIATYESFLETKQITWKEYYITKDKLLEQAKEMNKKEIIDAYKYAYLIGEDIPDNIAQQRAKNYLESLKKPKK